MDSQGLVRAASTATRASISFRAAFGGLFLAVAIIANAAAADRYAELVVADKPTGYWRLQKAEDGRVTSEIDLPDSALSLDGAIAGEVGLASAGPRTGEFPLFEPDNAAARFDGGAFIRIQDPGQNSPLDFRNGDAITLEAWISPLPADAGRFLYILGKGRTEKTGESSINQNYALRLKTLAGGKAALSFLFHSADDWHRWTSDAALALGDGWHHVAVSYKFGEPKGLRGYIDGESVTGKWDMGGATASEPAVDDDELWIGSSLGGQAASSFSGLIDEVALYRQALPAERIRARYRYTSPAPRFAADRVPAGAVLVEIHEGLPDKKSWRFATEAPSESFIYPAMAIVDVPNKYSSRGLKTDRGDPFLVRAMTRAVLPAGPRRLLVRCRNASRLYIDGNLALETPFYDISNSGHGHVTPLDASLAPGIRPLPRGDSQQYCDLLGDGREHEFIFEAIVGGQGHRPELGETSVSVAAPDEVFELLAPQFHVPLSDSGWESFAASEQTRLAAVNALVRRDAGRGEEEYWRQRHEWARRTVADRKPIEIPSGPADAPVTSDIDRFLLAKLAQHGQRPAALCDDYAFLRRATLDVIGTIPTVEEIAAFVAEQDREDRRSRLIDRLLADPGWADHWMGYWQDVLGENPNLVNPTLSNTGPFRWWIHESFADNKPFDRFAAEAVMMEGSKYYGGPAGFELATQDDAPMAAKARVVSQAFLGLEMKCARCHDDPYHDFKQRDLFSVAAMLRRGPQEVPKTSTVPGDEDSLKSLIVEVTLKPGEEIAPQWPFGHLGRDEFPAGVLRAAGDDRERLAALVTSPLNERFAQVIVNRLWRRYLGRGLVEPVDDWEDASPSHPELLDYLARELVGHDYDLKHIARLILNSRAYQRVPLDRGPAAEGPDWFAAPVARRMSAEQIVDSLFLAAGKPLRAGPMNIDIDGARPSSSSLNLGQATRAWHFTSLSNERDRPSLALPEAQPFVTLMEAFGWRGSRQDPVSVRSDEPAVLQPAIMANGALAGRITRLSDDGAFTALALEERSLEGLVEQVYLRLLSRPPAAGERAAWIALLDEGHAERRVEAPVVEREPVRQLVSWSNHLAPEANVFKADLEKRVRQGDPPTRRLQADWRERMEDMIWALINSPEFVCLP
ncbi:MAG TPA: DUF1553 domain-containing protein [Pirellulales bacterium]|nr:DUF1553 domain-containing protein [Pirellulales bacterium]